MRPWGSTKPGRNGSFVPNVIRLNRRRTLIGVAVLCLTGSAAAVAQVVTASPASAHTAQVHGTAVCLDNGDREVTWMGTTTNVPGSGAGHVAARHDRCRHSRRLHHPLHRPRSRPGREGACRRQHELPAHADDPRRVGLERWIAASQAAVTVSFVWGDGNKDKAYGTTKLPVNCEPSTTTTTTTPPPSTTTDDTAAVDHHDAAAVDARPRRRRRRPRPRRRPRRRRPTTTTPPPSTTTTPPATTTTTAAVPPPSASATTQSCVSGVGPRGAGLDGY